MRKAIIVLVACGGPSTPAQVDTHFACGKEPCDARAQYCQKTASDVVGGADTYACKTLPGVCQSSRDCACFPQDTPCALFKLCAVTGAGFTLTCPGG